MVDHERPEWALWLQQQRHERHWSWRRLARELRQRADKRGWRLPSDDDLIRMMRRWERGEHKPGERYRELLAEVYDDSAAANATSSLPCTASSSGSARPGRHRDS